MSPFDILIGGILIVSGLMGFARGATREVTTVLAFGLALAGAIYGLRLTGPIARSLIHAAWLANFVAVVVSFVAFYVILSVAAGALIRGIRQTSLSGLDRVMGFGVGLLRGWVIGAAIMLLIMAATPVERMPGWIRTAKLYPLANTGAKALQILAPRGLTLSHDVVPFFGAPDKEDYAAHIRDRS